VAAVAAYVPHAAVLPHSAVAINHAGHGSVMQALAFGVPLVCMPSVGADQPIVAARVAALGAGRSIPSDASAENLHDTIEEVVTTSTYRAKAQTLGEVIARTDGAAEGASALEACASSVTRPESYGG